jgi:DNA modification methylase
MTWTIHHGDCLEFARSLPPKTVDAVVADPPYGMKWNTDTNRFSGGRAPSGRNGLLSRKGPANHYGDIIGDDKPFDPAPWLDFPKVCLWGANHYAAALPVGTTLVWIKRNESHFETFLSDAEIGWIKGGHGVYCRRIVFTPGSRMKEAGLKGCVGHPAQKPVALMKWCFERMKLKPGDTVLDPYCGSGSTGVAALQCGLNFIGCELDATYVATARRRLTEAAAKQATPLLECPQ